MSYGGWYNPQYMASYQGSSSGSYYAYVWPLQQQQSYQPYYGYRSFSYQQPAQAAWPTAQAFVPGPSLQHTHPQAQLCSLCSRPLDVQTQTMYTCSNLQCANHAPTAAVPAVPPPPLAPAAEVQPAPVLAPGAAVISPVAEPVQAVVPPVIPPKIPIAAPPATTGPDILAPTDSGRSGRAHISFQHPLEPQPTVFDAELTMSGGRDGGGANATADPAPVTEVVVDPGHNDTGSFVQHGRCDCKSGMTACECLRMVQAGGCNIQVHHYQHCCDGDICHGGCGRSRCRKRDRGRSNSSSDENDAKKKGEATGGRAKGKGEGKAPCANPDPAASSGTAGGDLI
jgi:hypothetical protein